MFDHTGKEKGQRHGDGDDDRDSPEPQLDACGEFKAPGD
jgi:hypothetical protein